MQYVARDLSMNPNMIIAPGALNGTTISELLFASTKLNYLHSKVKMISRNISSSVSQFTAGAFEGLTVNILFDDSLTIYFYLFIGWQLVTVMHRIIISVLCMAVYLKGFLAEQCLKSLITS